MLFLYAQYESERGSESEAGRERVVGGRGGGPVIAHGRGGGRKRGEWCISLNREEG